MERIAELLYQSSAALRHVKQVYVLDVNEDGEPNAEVLDILAMWSVIGKLLTEIEDVKDSL